MGRLIHILKGILIIEKEEYSYEKYWKNSNEYFKND